MIAKMIISLCAVTLCAGAAHAGSSARGAGDESKDKLVCRTESLVGSRLRREKTCRTRAEWAEIRRQTKQDLERIQNQPPISGNN